MFDELRQVPLFADLSDEQLQWVKEHTSEITLQPGEILFAEGDPANYFYVLLEGEGQVTKRMRGQDTVLATHHEGVFTGEVPLLAGTPCIATARALLPSRLLKMGANDFQAMLVVCPPVIHLLLSTMAQRIQATDSLMQQREKLVALGTLAAGLAHELNNPAAAANRAAEQLRKTFQTSQSLSFQINTLSLSLVQQKHLAELQQKALKQATTPPQIDPLEQSDREEALTDWLD